MEPDDDDDVAGFFEWAHQETFHSITKKNGREVSHLIKIKGDELVNIEKDENKRMDAKSLKATNQEIKKTLDHWSSNIQEKCQKRINACIHLDRSKRETFRRFCQLNDILQDEQKNYQDISVLIDHQRNIIDILSSDLTQNVLQHRRVDT